MYLSFTKLIAAVTLVCFLKLKLAVDDTFTWILVERGRHWSMRPQKVKKGDNLSFTSDRHSTCQQQQQHQEQEQEQEQE